MEVALNAPPETSSPALAPVYQALAQDIRARGVQVAFGLLSNDTTMLVVALEAAGVRFYGTRHETNAVAAAEGYAATSGELGVAVIGRGPGAANALNGVMNASRSGSPVLVMFGEAPVAQIANTVAGPDRKRFDAVGVFTAAGVPTFVATSAEAARAALADAVTTARTGQAATLHLPEDVQTAEVETSDVDGESTPAPAQVAAPRPKAVETAVALLSGSRRPLIVAGVGAHRAGAREVLEELAEHTGALLITTLKAKDMFRGNAYDLGISGSFSHSAARRLVDQTDCVLAFGASLNSWTTSYGTFVPPAPIIQVDTVRSNIGRYSFADVAIVGDAREVAEQLLKALPARAEADKPFRTEETRRLLADFEHARDFEPAHTDWTVDPRALAIELDLLLPADRSIVADAGNFLLVTPYFTVPGPDHLKYTSDFGSIGMGFGTALGVATARPESTTVLLVGDGGLLMTLGELETVAREDIPVVVVVLNDHALGAERHTLERHNLPITKAVCPDVDFAALAEALGYDTATITSLSDVRRLGPTLANPQGPILLDCKVTPEVAAPFNSERAEFRTKVGLS